MKTNRRRWLQATTSLATSRLGWAPSWASASATTATLRFPQDAGAHPAFKTEWWYITGWVGDAAGNAAYGFQVTFFRSRVDSTQSMRSRLAARQLLFAHAAITDVKGKHLWHDQRVARWSGEAPGQNVLDTAAASLQDTGIRLRDWSLLRDGADLHARLTADNCAMDLRFSTTQPVLLQGQQGLSRKGPEPQHTSYYYSLPQLRVSGSLTLQGSSVAIGAAGTTGTAWLDHEWSNEILPKGAVGWDWLGINFFDGSALTAFRLRDAQGGALWDGGSFRSGEALYIFNHGETRFKPLRQWQSNSSRASYPVEWLVRTPADFYTVRALVDNQELDSRNSTGAIYWEGLCEVWDSNNKKVGHGYLEMTGYAAPLNL